MYNNIFLTIEIKYISENNRRESLLYIVLNNYK